MSFSLRPLIDGAFMARLQRVLFAAASCPSDVVDAQELWEASRVEGTKRLEALRWLLTRST